MSIRTRSQLAPTSSATALFILVAALDERPAAPRGAAWSRAWSAMALAVARHAAADPDVVNWGWIVGGRLLLGFAVGVPLSWVPLTAVPQRTALSHAFGGLAAGLVGTAKFYLLAAASAREPDAVPHDGDRGRGDPGLSSPSPAA